MVPITISTSEDPNQAKLKILMDKSEMNVVLKNVNPDQWVKVSSEMTKSFISETIDFRHLRIL
jgi:hypothetical protein